MDAIKLTSWVCQGYLAFFFLRSAYRKTANFTRVAEEFQRWGYPYPEAVTAFLAVVWVIAGISLLVPPLVVAAALLL
ncbi:MAG: DoxX family protein, partial [Planctomycetota bacterium]